MSEFLGSRISLISKSDIRYSGVLHEINSEQSTVSLENVRSFGTEGRRGNPDEEIVASDQVYDYIVFRGSDVKDLRIEETPATKENHPPPMPDDPAILGARPRPTGPPSSNFLSGPNNQDHRAHGTPGVHPAHAGPPGTGSGGASGFNVPEFQQQPGNSFYPPPAAQWGRGDPRYTGMPPYPPPPPGWYPNNFPPGGPGAWSTFGYPGHQGGHLGHQGHHPGDPQGHNQHQGHPQAHPQTHPQTQHPQAHRQGAVGAPDQRLKASAQRDNKPTPIGTGIGAAVGADKAKAVDAPSHAEPSADPNAHGHRQGQASMTTAPMPAPAPPVGSKPSVQDVKESKTQMHEPLNNSVVAAKITPVVPVAPVASPSQSQSQSSQSQSQSKNIPTGPKNSRITPAVPLPSAILSRPGPTVPAPTVPAPTATAQQATATSVTVQTTVAEQGNGMINPRELRDATQQAKAAVAVAMAKLQGSDATGPGLGAAPANGSGHSANVDNLTRKLNEMTAGAPRGGATRGRARASRGGHGGTNGNNAKLGVPKTDFDFEMSNAKFNKQDLVKEAVAGSPKGEVPNGTAEDGHESKDTAQLPGYNKKASFFDNISSDAKDRAGSNFKPGGREWRGEEQRKNMETFGQSSVDGSFRGHRGRGRGRGRAYGRGGRGMGNFRSRHDLNAISH